MSTWAWALLCVGCGGGLIGFVVGAWRGERHDDAVWQDGHEVGYQEGHDDGVWAVAPEMASVRTVRQEDDPARPDADELGPPLPPAVPAAVPVAAIGARHVDVPRPGDLKRTAGLATAAGPGHPPLTGEAWQPDGHLLASMTPRMRERYEQDAEPELEPVPVLPADRGIFAFIDDDAEAFRYIRWGLAGVRAELRRPLELPAWPQPALAAA